MTRRWPANGVALAVLWVFVRGVPLTPTRLAEEFVIGLGVGFGLAYGFRRFYAPTTPLARTVRVVPYAGLYVVVFLYELITANFDVARRILTPSLPIDPAVVEVPLRVESEAAITLIANSITLTPGTLTMDYDADSHALYVHSIDGSDPEAVLEPIRRWEDYALVMFEESRDPTDAVPERPATDGGRESGPDGRKTGQRRRGDGQ
jgi:multicomponent Na+:H+ antiporter subunit E